MYRNPSSSLCSSYICPILALKEKYKINHIAEYIYRRIDNLALLPHVNNIFIIEKHPWKERNKP